MQHSKVVAYASHQLKDYEHNYLTHDLEFTVVVFTRNLEALPVLQEDSNLYKS